MWGAEMLRKPSVLAVALRRNVHYRFMYLNTCALLAGPFENIMDHLGGRALLEEVCHCGWALRFYSLAPLPVFFLGFLCAEDNVMSQLPAPAAMPVRLLGLPTMID